MRKILLNIVIVFLLVSLPSTSFSKLSGDVGEVFEYYSLLYPPELYPPEGPASMTIHYYDHEKGFYFDRDRGENIETWGASGVYGSDVLSSIIDCKLSEYEFCIDTEDFIFFYSCDFLLNEKEFWEKNGWIFKLYKQHPIEGEYFISAKEKEPSGESSVKREVQFILSQTRGVTNITTVELGEESLSEGIPEFPPYFIRKAIESLKVIDSGFGAIDQVCPS